MNRFRGTAADLARLALAAAPEPTPTGAARPACRRTPRRRRPTPTPAAGRPLTPARRARHPHRHRAPRGPASGRARRHAARQRARRRRRRGAVGLGRRPRRARATCAPPRRRDRRPHRAQLRRRASATGLVVAAHRRRRAAHADRVRGAATHLVADLVGYYDVRGGRRRHAGCRVDPARFVDTRTGLGAARGPAAGDLTVTLPASVPADARGAVLNVSAVDARARHLRAGRAAATARATVLNVAGGRSAHRPRPRDRRARPGRSR